MLPREEYVEQAYMFRALGARLNQNEPVQELLAQVREEILATSKLPHAIDFILAELNHTGAISTAMRRMQHYFAPFQTYLVFEAENERGRLDTLTAMKILEFEARFRAEQAPPGSMFFYQFEVLCRNRLSYDRGLTAMAGDSLYDNTWKKWILDVRQKIGIVDLADLVYVHSQYYCLREQAAGSLQDGRRQVTLFGEKEGRIALANRRKEPLFFFAALQRQLDYPSVPRLEPRDPKIDLLPRLQRTVERLEMRLKLLEDEQRDRGIDLSQFYRRPDSAASPGE